MIVFLSSVAQFLGCTFFLIQASLAMLELENHKSRDYALIDWWESKTLLLENKKQVMISNNLNVFITVQATFYPRALRTTS
jgi:hypothetical protein